MTMMMMLWRERERERERATDNATIHLGNGGRLNKRSRRQEEGASETRIRCDRVSRKEMRDEEQ